MPPALADALAELPEQDRAQIIEHVRRLAELPGDRRSAVLTAISTLTAGGTPRRDHTRPRR